MTLVTIYNILENPFGIEIARTVSNTFKNNEITGDVLMILDRINWDEILNNVPFEKRDDIKNFILMNVLNIKNLKI